MPKSTSLFHVGIDLGTTHTVVAYAHKGKEQPIKLFSIPQLIAPGQVDSRDLMPSVRYHPAENELNADAMVFSHADETAVIGEAARVLGAKAKGRLVTSAKSWLSHPSVDQDADILPWNSHDDIRKVSPVEASASYLRHIRTVWNQQHANAPLEHQNIVITVPASFDEAARALTVEAAKRAGLAQIRLLEEPQAVCYDWLRRHADKLNHAIGDRKLLLICDIGGGTTDLTLIQIRHGGNGPELTRIAVGEHIMLGGDNIDLALAHAAESRLQAGENRLSAADFAQLTEQCRIAKERLLSVDAPDQVTVTLLGGGSKLIGGARSTTLTRQEAVEIALDGFFPITQRDELPSKKRSGVVEFGLPYPAEPAISKHIAAFLQLHKTGAQQARQSDDFTPDALLLNGGLFRSKAIKERMLALFNAWGGQPINLLENNNPELAVAFGAVSFALARAENKLQIGGGAGRGYFLAVESVGSKDQESIRQGVCVLPKGSEEGKEILLHHRRFALRTGMPVRFDLFSFSGDTAFQPGDLVNLSEDFHALPPLITSLGENAAITPQQESPVQLGVTHTELGTLKIQCIEADTTNNPPLRWDVEFQIRRTKSLSPSPAGSDLPPQTNTAIEAIALVFGPKSKQVDPNAVKNLRNQLEKILGQERSQWPTNVLRALYDALWDGHKYRRRSAAHERVWLGLTGFCLRPGFGSALDGWRMEQLWQLYAQGLQFVQENQNWSEWWTLWRRVAGGLGADFQDKIFNDVVNYLNPASLRQPTIAKQAKLRSADEMIRLIAVLERLDLGKKIQIGGWLLKRMEKSCESGQTGWALGRVGARLPFYGGAHTAVPAETAAQWLEALLLLDWKKTPQSAFAATLIARNSGDRVRDIDPVQRERVIVKLNASKSPATWIEMVEHYRELDASTESQFLGETLPPGLQLISES